MLIKLNKDLEGSSAVKVTNVSKLEKATVNFPKGYSYPIGRLVKVEAVDYESETMGEKTTETRLQFTFKEQGDNKKGSIIVSEFAPKANDKFEANLERMNRRIMHVFENTIGKGVMSNDIEAATFGEYFRAVAEEFNKHTIEIDGKNRKLFAKIPQYMKIVYGTDKNSNRQQFPAFPNYLEPALDHNNKQVPCSLDVNPSRDLISSPTVPQGNGMPNMGGGAMNTSFGAGSEDDFPDELG